MKDKNKLIKTIVLWSVYAILVITTILLFVLFTDLWKEKVVTGYDANKNPIYDPDSLTVFDKDVSTVPFFQWCYEFGLRGLLKSIQIVTIALTLAIALHYFTRIIFRSKKGRTISRLFVSFLKWTIALCALFFIMDAFGANTTTILASAGVVTLIIGLGSQSLVADILAGIFIVFEGEFQVGDIVIIDGWRGEVKEIGIRTTKLIDAGYNIKIVNNSEIKTIINQTQELSLAKAYVAVSYGARIEKIEAVIADNLEQFKEKIPAIVEGPYYKGVSELGESGVTLLFVAKCNEDDIYQVQRDMNREIKIMFDNNGIEIPFNQLVVHRGEDADQDKVSKKDIKKAEDFNKEQKELSDDISVEK